MRSAFRSGSIVRAAPFSLFDPTCLAAASLDDSQRSVKLERENRFRFHADVTLRHRLSRRAAAGADAGADRRALAAAEQRADDAADRRAAADEFGGALVLAETRAALLFEIDGAQGVLTAVDRHGREVEHEIRLALDL